MLDCVLKSANLDPWLADLVVCRIRMRSNEVRNGFGPMNNPLPFDVARRRLLALLYRQGIRNLDVLAAFQNVPRERFVDSKFADEAYENYPLPIGYNQTISQPYIVARMTETLSVTKDCRVLEIGTGSGYQTAILARLAREVFTIERIEALSRQASQTLADLHVCNVRFRVDDGTLGWPEEAPFDRILVGAVGPRIPPSLVEQLAEGGRIVIPVQRSTGKQQGLYIYTKHSGELEPLYLGGCRFVPLIGEEGFPVEQAD